MAKLADAESAQADAMEQTELARQKSEVLPSRPLGASACPPAW